MTTATDRRDPGRSPLPPGTSAGGEGSPSHGGGHSSSAPAGPPIEIPFRHRSGWYYRAFRIAAQRTMTAFHENRVQFGGDSVRNRFDKDIVGALGESAVSVALGIDWNPVRTYDYGGDVGNLHVRSTPYLDGKLAVYPKDPDDAPFVLVVIDYRATVARLAGWITGAEAKAIPTRSISKGYRPAHWVEQSGLRPIGLLRERAAV